MSFTKPNLKGIAWLSPPDVGGENVSSIQFRYLSQIYGWEADYKNPALIYAGSESVVGAAIKLKVQMKRPLLMNFWGWMPQRFQDTKWATHYLQKIALINEHVDYITVPSALVAEELIRYGINKDISICSPGIDTSLALVASGKSFTPRIPYVISVGRLVSHKNFATIIRALSGLQTPLIIIGKGESKEQQMLIDLAKALNVSLELLTDVSDAEKFQLISTSLCLVTASTYEGFGLPIVEAASLGIPVLAYDLPSHRKLFEGCLDYFSDSLTLSCELLKLKNDRKYRRQVAKQQAWIGLRYSGHYAATQLNALLVQQLSAFYKDKLYQSLKSKEITEAQVYDFESELDAAHFRYRLDPNYPMFKTRLNKLLEYVQGNRILDLGTSTGVFATHLASKGMEVDTVDISKGYQEIAKKTIESYGLSDKVRFHNVDIRKLPFKDKTFDSAWMGEIIEHFVNSTDIIKEVIRTLKPGGRLIFTLPYGDHCYDPLHLQNFHTSDDINNLFKDIPNFELKKLEYCSDQQHNWAGWGVKI